MSEVEDTKMDFKGYVEDVKQNFIARFTDFCKELDEAGLRLFTQQVIMDGTPGNVYIGITEK